MSPSSSSPSVDANDQDQDQQQQEEEQESVPSGKWVATTTTTTTTPLSESVLKRRSMNKKRRNDGSSSSSTSGKSTVKGVLGRIFVNATANLAAEMTRNPNRYYEIKEICRTINVSNRSAYRALKPLLDTQIVQRRSNVELVKKGKARVRPHEVRLTYGLNLKHGVTKWLRKIEETKLP